MAAMALCSWMFHANDGLLLLGAVAAMVSESPRRHGSNDVPSRSRPMRGSKGGAARSRSRVAAAPRCPGRDAVVLPADCFRLSTIEGNDGVVLPADCCRSSQIPGSDSLQR
ncbi:hypothetical protein PR202_gb05372 [Eleusine coracana subsp. coracana]|uniref:Secreted protein n=1 Tax=Eleusine coracana subsp. coracana TaxID=191504 RepID=A0AAV5E6J1_ELECO|nr:hypothetical protein PR202_gb05372 [Eleusine coracana subsp. coracana]